MRKVVDTSKRKKKSALKSCTVSIASNFMPFECKKSRNSLLTRPILLPQPSTSISGTQYNR